MQNYPMPFPTIIDAIIKALESALPERVTGAHFGTYSSVRFRGRRPNGRIFDVHDSGHGGWGACASHDGAGPFRTMAHGDTRIVPLELQESVYPFRYEELMLRQDSAGAGKFRGGLGFRKTYTILAPCTLGVLFDRVKHPPWGVCGGKDAMAGQVIIAKPGGTTTVVYKTRDYPLEPGDRVSIETGGGGGYGPPSERAPEQVRRDLAHGYISAEAAARDYGLLAAD
jgi:N-methylhydantoinase B